MDFDIYFYVDNRLNERANWLIRRGDLGLGCPHKTTEALLIEGGGVWVRSTAPRDFSYKETVEEINNLIKELAKQNWKIASALQEYYLGSRTLREGAKNLGISRTQFKVHIDMAKHWLAGRLSA